jgi:hypothetical protein
MIFKINFFYVVTQHELVELGAPKMEGQFLALGPMSYFTKKNLLK